MLFIPISAVIPISTACTLLLAVVLLASGVERQDGLQMWAATFVAAVFVAIVAMLANGLIM